MSNFREHSNLQEQASNLVLQVAELQEVLQEKEASLKGKEQEISKFEDTKAELLKHINVIKEQFQRDQSSDRNSKSCLEEVETRHLEEVTSLQEAHTKEVQRLQDQWEEEQVATYCT